MNYILAYITIFFTFYIIIKNSIIQQNSVWNDFITINSKNAKSKILFYPFIGCGYANKIPALLSSFLLSLISYHPILIINWYQLLFYFKLPKLIFAKSYNHSKINSFTRKNTTAIKMLIINQSIRIYTYHSFTALVLVNYNLTKRLKLIMKEKIKKNITLEMYLYKIFFKPQKNIASYIRSFKSQSKNKCIVGIHIRTGYLSDFGEKDNRFFSNSSISTYKNKINNILNTYKKCNLYIVSDSTLIKHLFIREFKNYIFNFFVPGKICHARNVMHGEMKENKCIIKFIAENYLLSLCKIIVGCGKSTYFRMACTRNNIQCISV